MALAELLSMLGIPGTIVVLVSVALGLYHLREVMVLASVASTYFYVGAFVLAVLLLAEVGLIPGVELNVTGQFFRLVGNIFGVLVDGAWSIWEAVA